MPIDINVKSDTVKTDKLREEGPTITEKVSLFLIIFYLFLLQNKMTSTMKLLKENLSINPEIMPINPRNQSKSTLITSSSRVTI